MANKPELEGHYDILQNSNGELMLSIRSRKGVPENPKILYDGGKHALLYRNKKKPIFLDYINPKISKSLFSVETVIIAEFIDNGGIARSYSVPVKRVRKLPVSKEFLKRIH